MLSPEATAPNPIDTTSGGDEHVITPTAAADEPVAATPPPTEPNRPEPEIKENVETSGMNEPETEVQK